MLDSLLLEGTFNLTVVYFKNMKSSVKKPTWVGGIIFWIYIARRANIWALSLKSFQSFWLYNAWLTDFNNMKTGLELFYAYNLKNQVHCMNTVRSNTNNFTIFDL